ncbi:MAG: glycosyltransferase family 4 protein, partial [Candidatus Omnitrophica bacterium]|nr:glycosyltransferase family 4 protein [Candidatus Omnitrophota bacterium]
IGEGPVEKDIKAKIDNEGVENVVLLGYKTKQELGREIANSMFVVLPSEWYENNPRSVIEGFAYGKPVVGSRIGGIVEMVKDDVTGLTFEPGNSEDLHMKIEYLASNPSKIIEMGKSARLVAEKEFSGQRHYDGLMEIYNQAINSLAARKA